MSGKRICFLAYGHNEEINLDFYRHGRMYKMLEQKCSQSGVHFDPRPIRREYYDSPDLGSLDDILGVFLIAGKLWPVLDSLLRDISIHEMPIAVLDESDRLFHVYRKQPQFSRSHIFALAHLEAGQRLAEELYRLGHRKIIFLSPFHHFPWSRARLDGLRSAAESLSDLQIIDCVENNTPSVDKIDELLSLHDGGKNVSRETLLDDLLTDRLDPSSKNKVLAGLRSLHQREELLIIQNNCFHEALKEGTDCVWVGANDDVALQAIQFLTRRGIEVPDSISVVGYDNSDAAIEAGMSSFDFGLEDLSLAVFEYICRRPLDTLRIGPTERKIQGKLISRSSVKSIPRH